MGRRLGSSQEGGQGEGLGSGKEHTLFPFMVLPGTF